MSDSFDLWTREDAIAELERFIVEAQATLVELRTAPETPKEDEWSLR